MPLRAVLVAVLIALLPSVALAAPKSKPSARGPRVSVKPDCAIAGQVTTLRVRFAGFGPKTRHTVMRGPMANLAQDADVVGTFRANQQGAMVLTMPFEVYYLPANLLGTWSLFIEPPGTETVAVEGSPHAHFRVVKRRSQC